MKIVPATTPEQLRQVRRLFEEYAASLSFDLSFQNFPAELAGLPGDYAPPEGGLWLATADRGEGAGCVALRRLEPTIGEMKRLYVCPDHRGSGLGKRLARTVLEEAAAIGYERVRLDTTPEMVGAVRLYESLGFTPIDPYRANPIEGALFMEMAVGRARGRDSFGSRRTRSIWSPRCSTPTASSTGKSPTLKGPVCFLAERVGRGESVIFAVAEGGRRLGFTQLYPSFSSVSMRPIWVLNDLFVAADARRRGFGTLLLGRPATTPCAGAARLALSTAVTNADAQALYERDGWRRDTGYFHYEFELPREGH